MGTLPNFDAGPLPLAYLRYLTSLHMQSNALVFPLFGPPASNAQVSCREQARTALVDALDSVSSAERLEFASS